MTNKRAQVKKTEKKEKPRTERFTWKADDVSISQCIFCIQKDGINCKAFPKGIPDKILSNEVDHTKPYKGDNGVRFEKRK